MAEKRPIIIIKKKGGHGGHHGGAWKVAYADFVTAMMAFFMVMWLLNSTTKPEQEAIAGYFKDPNGVGKKAGTSMASKGEDLTVTRDDMPKLKEQLEAAMHKMPDFEKISKNIEMTITGEGLRIELSESALGTFYDSGSPKLNKDGRDMIILLANELGKVPNNLSIEGHTDSKPYAKGGAYSNWELSTDRANAARHLMQANGVREDQVKQVRGFADQRLRKRDNPEDPSNRRISVIVQYMAKTQEELKAEEEEEEKSKAKEGEKSEGKGKDEKKSEGKPEGKGEGKSEAQPAAVGEKPAAGTEAKPDKKE
jgi:chemotaxis protein MotB